MCIYYFVSHVLGIPESMEHATGLEKKELEKIQAGESVSTRSICYSCIKYTLSVNHFFRATLTKIYPTKINS